MREESRTGGCTVASRPQSIPDSPRLLLRVHAGAVTEPTLVHIPGLHGDWTLLAPFRQALKGRVCLVETTYPRQPEWSLDDYAAALETALVERAITSGWILGESFSSQVAWQFLARQQARGASSPLRIDGLILVGGFIRHPWTWGVRVARAGSRAVPMWLLRLLCGWYGRGAKKRFADCPDAALELDEFVGRRANEPDRRVITRRYGLIAENDPGEIVRRTTLPVYHLSGAWDPIVPWWQVRGWLRRHCPGYRTSRIIRTGGHNVLLSSPEKSAEQILEWIGRR